MFSGEGGRFGIGQSRAEGNVEILFGESAVAGQYGPDQQSEKLAQQEAYCDGQQPDERNQKKSEQIEQTIHEQKRRR